MLVFGTANPAGVENNHKGVYLRQQDIADIVSSGSLVNKPVHIEHCGEPVGEVISAWKNGERLDCILKINNNSIDGIFAQEFVRQKKCPELSMSYNVVMENSKDGLKGERKEMLEISIVKAGARPNCNIYGFSAK
jgi:hypothetical protein